ncbi:uncharacterized protein L969DRAFT_50604 [Mixia osmundae IAM 14324]|uniref:Uncharacterized protein n=1 Tax=Mixia osmundae (strain CBS 9802 / IAM 14324 / JCM 22182 / KY 12970) TaxID=764103 RepID=G7E719_MIXOS|nr:uncharacterized protein L969DRAFT_50604 [Mixia osmundae IAM 14324]KEI38989.1 hypothetical protein L969DRAFT_50604 [Mixia osmundae IAM 14324]GAA98629.1 hypothetical protein E5Q_05316 [Mixia osmundae IAM 14324]
MLLLNNLSLLVLLGAYASAWVPVKSRRSQTGPFQVSVRPVQQSTDRSTWNISLTQQHTIEEAFGSVPDKAAAYHCCWLEVRLVFETALIRVDPMTLVRREFTMKCDASGSKALYPSLEICEDTFREAKSWPITCQWLPGNCEIKYGKIEVGGRTCKYDKLSNV